MNEQEKSLKLAELMGWEVELENGVPFIDTLFCIERCLLNPYIEGMYSENGLAQFAAILLKFPEVMERCVDGAGKINTANTYGEVNQANILDAILKMNGIAIEDGMGEI